MEDLGAPTPLTKIDIDQSIKGSKVDYKQYFEYVQGDISKMKADVIVNSIPPSMYSSFGVCKSIHDKSGPNLLKYLKYSLGVDLYTVGVCLIVVACSLALSVSSTILLVVIINIELKKNQDAKKLVNTGMVPEMPVNYPQSVIGFK